ncbi:MAG: DUF4115 domain-containing protein [Firmicutes bacterium]|nr:DUF4115 domain-containing protein [Bacillota bacterium]
MLRELGGELRAARQQRGLTIADVQTETKIRSRYLEALEEGRMDILPGDVYAKGFLKTYAHFLGLNGHAFVERYKQWQTEQEGSAGQESQVGPAASTATPVTPPAEIVVRSRAKGKRGKRGKRGLGLGLGLAALLIVSIVAGAWLAWRSWSAWPEGRAGQGEASPVQQPAQAPDSSDGTDGTPPGPGGGATAGSAVTLEPGTPPDQFTVPFTAHGAAGQPLKLTVTVSAACWIRLERAGGAVVEQTLPPGSSLTWDFTGEARIKLGNPPAAKLQVSGAPVPDPVATYPVTYVFTQS